MRRTDKKEIIVFGCGGVGSWVIDFLYRGFRKNIEHITLVDFDIVEDKNLVRQHFFRYNLGDYKTSAVYQNLVNIEETENIVTVRKKITSDVQLYEFDPEAIAIIVTDNIKSKRMIAKYFTNFIILNCDKNFAEMKTFLDETDLKAWDTGGGYSNEQDIVSNIAVCSMALDYLSFYLTHDVRFNNNIHVVYNLGYGLNQNFWTIETNPGDKNVKK